MSRYPIHHGHELVHHGAGQNEGCIVNLAADYSRPDSSVRRPSVIRGSNRHAVFGQRHHHRDQCHRARAQNRGRKLHGKTRASLGPREQPALIFAGGRCRRKNFLSQECPVIAVGVFVLAKECGKISPQQFLRRIPEQLAERGIARAELPLQIGGENRHRRTGRRTRTTSHGTAKQILIVRTRARRGHIAFGMMVTYGRRFDREACYEKHDEGNQLALG